MKTNRFSSNQKKVLALLYRAGPLPLPAIIAKAGPTPPASNPRSKSPYTTTYRCVKALSSDGLVIPRGTDPEGRTTYALTPAGRTWGARFWDEATQYLAGWTPVLNASATTPLPAPSLSRAITFVPRDASRENAPLVCDWCGEKIPAAVARAAFEDRGRVTCHCHNDLTGQARALLA